MARLTNPRVRMLDMEPMDTPEDGLLSIARPQVAGQQVPQDRPALNYQDIIAQATKAGFTPYAGDGPMQAMVGGLEVTPYMEMTGQTEQDPGQSQQMGYTVSTPLGGTTYRTDVVDMNGNLLRSNEHDAGADKYGLGDMAKMAAFALGANALGGLTGEAASGSLTAGVTPASVAASEAALPTALSSAPLTTALAAPAAELTAGGLLAETAPGVFAPATLSEAAVSSLPTLAAPAAAATAPTVMSSADKAAMLSGDAYGPGMTGAQTSAYDATLGATGSKTLADAASSVVGAGSTAADWIKANPTLAKMLFSGAGALLSATGGGGGNGNGGYVDSGYRPTISRGGFNAQPQARQMAPQPTMGLLTHTTGQPMSGLWRYGLLGG